MYFDGPKAFGLLCFSKEAENFISHGSGSLKAKIKVHGDSVSCERIFLLCFHMLECVRKLSFCLFHKGTTYIYEGFTLMT